MSNCLTLLRQLVEIPVPEILGVATELWGSFPGSHLQIIFPNPLHHPADLAVTRKKPDLIRKIYSLVDGVLPRG